MSSPRVLKNGSDHHIIRLRDGDIILTLIGPPSRMYLHISEEKPDGGYGFLAGVLGPKTLLRLAVAIKEGSAHE